MRISDAPSMTGTRTARQRPGTDERDAQAPEPSAREEEGDGLIDSLGLSTRGFAGMLSELALGTQALLPAGSTRAVQRAFLEWRDADLDEIDLVATAIAA